MEITVLIENTGPADLTHEHGLSLLLLYRGGRYLLDGGASGRFVENAAAMGLDLSRVDAVILSHGHYDHADGLAAFFQVNSTAQVFARPAVRTPDYSSDGRYIGVSPALLTRYGTRFNLDEGPRTLAPGLHLIPDPVPHQQSLVAETASGLVVLNSCCHGGAGFIVKALRNHFPGVPIRALVGGLHLMGAGGPPTLGVAPGIVKNLAHWLGDELEVGALYTGHCTGAPALALLREALGARLHTLTTGASYPFPD